MAIDQRKTDMATGALSHLIGAYYLLGGLVCNCNPQSDKEMREILLHLKGLYWAVMFKRYGIINPKKNSPQLKTRDLTGDPPKRPGAKFDMSDTGGL